MICDLAKSISAKCSYHFTTAIHRTTTRSLHSVAICKAVSPELRSNSLSGSLND